MIEIESFPFLVNFGFAVFVSVWFMYRLEPLIKTNNEVLAVIVEHLRKEK